MGCPAPLSRQPARRAVTLRRRAGSRSAGRNGRSGSGRPSRVVIPRAGIEEEPGALVEKVVEVDHDAVRLNQNHAIGGGFETAGNARPSSSENAVWWFIERTVDIGIPSQLPAIGL